MKNIILLIVILLISCNPAQIHREKQRGYKVHTSYGLGLSSTTVNCDSVKMITPKHARVYVDGVATDLYADKILVSN